MKMREKIGNEFKYGLMCLDPESKDEEGNTDMIHGAFYSTPPDQQQRDSLREELREELGPLLADRLLIMDMPEETVEHFLNEESKE